MLAGGRGKGRFANYPKGGVQLLFSAEEIEEAAKGMIGNNDLKFKNTPKQDCKEFQSKTTRLILCSECNCLNIPI